MLIDQNTYPKTDPVNLVLITIPTLSLIRIFKTEPTDAEMSMKLSNVKSISFYVLFILKKLKMVKSVQGIYGSH